VLRRHATALHLALALADATSAAAVFVVLSMARFGIDSWQAAWSSVGVPGGVAAVVYGLGWTLALWSSGLYRLRARWSTRREIFDLAVAALALGATVLIALFLFKLPDVSRLLLLVLFPTQVLVTFASRFALRFVFARSRERGFNLRYVLVAGANAAAQDFADLIESHPDLGLRVVGHLAGPGEQESPLVRRPILGGLGDLERVLHTQIVDEVAVCLPPESGRFIGPIAQICEEEGHVVRIPVPDSGLILPGGRQESFGGTTIMSLSYGPDRAIALAIKRLVDIATAGCTLVVLSPVLLVIALAIGLDGGGPILFRQERVGLRGRRFRVVKFRTMACDAEDRLDGLLGRNELAGPAFKMSHDPRVSRVGRWLRRSSVDELPQFWNVLRGEMSIVGPRPPLPREVTDYNLWHRRRLSMKPGITGLWQVKGRQEEDFDRWVRFDLAYIDRWSLWLDLKIMLQTLPAMLHGR
jgi:exopolysaccharide biosynthesis polyprenyl glycosylphosphotransferase